MSLPDPNNSYSFDDFLAWRNQADFYDCDPFFQQVIRHYAPDQWEALDQAARKISAKVSFEWKKMV